MEKTAQMPVLKGKIYIDPAKDSHEAYTCYASQKWHDKLNETIKDIKLCHTQTDIVALLLGHHSIKDPITEKTEQPHGMSYIFIPLIPVNVFIYEKNTGYNWTRSNETPTIVRFKQTTKITSFPQYLPITWLHKAKTGTKLSLTVHGFPTHLICSKNVYNPAHEKQFEEEFTIHIDSIKKEAPSYCRWYDEPHKAFYLMHRKPISSLEPAFIQQKLLKQSENDGTQYEYGDKPFTCIEELEKLVIFHRIQDVLPMQIIFLLLKHEYN